MRTSSLTVFLAGIAITAVTVATLTLTAAEGDRNEFAANAEETEDAVLDRVETSIALLRGTAGLFSSNEAAVTVQSFRAYVGRLALREQYPGLLGIGFSRRILPGEVQALEQEIRAQGQPDFRVWPTHPRAEMHTIVFLEPLDDRNRAAVGYDMYTDETRRAAMARARDTGIASASGIVELVQEIDEVKQPGFLIYLPVYQGGVLPPTVEERRARLLGFAYSPIRARDFLSSAFSHVVAPPVDFSVYHGKSLLPSSLIFEHASHSASAARFTSTSNVNVAGEPWTLVFHSRTTLAGSLVLPLIAALAGIALSWLLAVLVARETRARGEAQRALERERAARSEAERANAMKDQFLATLSHELRTPIGAIVGWAALLRRTDVADSRFRDAAEVIDRNAKAQAKLIDDLLDMNGIISGKLRMEFEPVNAPDTVNDALATLAPAAEAKGITIGRSIDPSPMTLRGDPVRLKQVVGNLLSNAVKFTPAGGHVHVTLERAERRVRLIVTDTGEGIDPAALDHIFDRFAQADSSIARRHSGLGLGLAIVRQLIVLHGGTVRAESSGPGHGATFTVELPLADAAANVLAPASVDSESHSLEGLKVLVVDDERDARELVRFVLEERKASVRCAGSGAEALIAISAMPPDVLVSDIGMPGMDGYELMRRIGALRAPGASDMVAIALTAYAHDADRAEALRAGFDLHLVKPISPEDLVAVISSVTRPEALSA